MIDSTMVDSLFGMRYVYRVYGDPVPWKAPITSVVSLKNPSTDKNFMLGHSPPSALHRWQAEIRKQVLTQSQPPDLLRCPIKLTLWVFLVRPKTNRHIYPDAAANGDDANYLKAAQDALNAQWGRHPGGKRVLKAPPLVWQDDGQCIDSRVRLRWAYYQYADLEEPRRPGLIYVIDPIIETPTERHERNKAYRVYLKSRHLEYQTMKVGKGDKAKKKTILIEI